jgi:hypothetical protein
MSHSKCISPHVLQMLSCIKCVVQCVEIPNCCVHASQYVHVLMYLGCCHVMHQENAAQEIIIMISYLLSSLEGLLSARDGLDEVLALSNSGLVALGGGVLPLVNREANLKKYSLYKK